MPNIKVFNCLNVECMNKYIAITIEKVIAM